MSILLKAGEVFSGCEILGRCGKGAFGITYLARNPIGQKIIIKIISSPRSAEREMRGVRNYMQVSGTHPNLLKILHIGSLEDGFFYTMEAADDCGDGIGYIPATLGNLFRRKRFSPEEAIRIIRDLLAAVKVMHDAHLIHRDIKPDNIIFVDGVPKLSDPGLVVEEGQNTTFAGTPGFIPPETLDGEKETDQRDDLYALGKVFYCMVTGYPAKRYPQLPEDLPISVCRQIYPALTRMCNRDPVKRFRNADEFLAGLPAELAAPTRWETMRENFRDWRILNREKFRRLVLLAVLLAVLPTAAGIGAVLCLAAREKELARCRAETEAYLAREDERPGLTELQIAAYLPDRLAGYRKLAGELQKARAAADWSRAAERTRAFRKWLGETAARAVPDLAADPGDLAAGLAEAGRVHGFLASPLALHLAPDRLAELKQKLAAYEEKLYADWHGLRAGHDWNYMQHFDFPMVFVPPGALRMRHSGDLVRLDHPYWICRTEVRHEDFAGRVGISPQKSPYPNTPVERVSWNDALFFCWQATQALAGVGTLPPGYIVRLPTEAEWEYAADNAMLGPDTAPLAERAVIAANAAGRTWPAGNRKPNRLGLFDIYGNVAEYCLPHRKPVLQNAVVARGGSFRCRQEEDCFRQVENLMYQCIPDDIGFRVVIAPGTMEYFDRHFFLSGPAQARIGGKVYELVGANYGAFRWTDAEALARLLGGRLAEFDSPEEMAKVRRALPQFGTWETLLGGRRIDGRWRWVSDGRPVAFGEWRKSGVAGEFLVLHGGKWLAVPGNRFPVFLCEWDADAYPRRNDKLAGGAPMPLELVRFVWRGRKFMLLDVRATLCSGYRICELLGGRLACLDSPELRAYAVDKLKDFRELPIMLGGYAKRDRWHWLSGKDDPLKPKPDPHSIPMRNLNVITLKKGEFYDSFRARMVLCEWPASSDSAH